MAAFSIASNPPRCRPVIDPTIGYCTNVHAGVDLESIRNNLDRHATAVRIASQQESLGVGLWLPAQAARELSGNAEDFANFLQQRCLRAFTINGFPYDNFHQRVVKHRVYQPTWWEPARLEYTKQLADLLAVLLPDDEPLGSISTLPIGWSGDGQSQANLTRAAEHLRQMANHLERLEATTGRRIVLAIEPEPGCILDTTEDVVTWFSQTLPETKQRRYITVCHDICHAAVMMESQAGVINALSAAGIAIGKVQVSSAVVADWNAMAIGRRREAIDQLRQFAEDRYLHQTGRRNRSGDFLLSEDLPALLDSVATSGDPVRGDEKWVVHFHVPIFLERFGHLGTSQQDVLECLSALYRSPTTVEFSGHVEIETYAWSVLPAAMRKRALADEIASEFRWLQRAIAAAI
jgi:sugar phosphate isomerase/epimerase